MSDLVGNPEDRFSCVAAHIIIIIIVVAVVVVDIEHIGHSETTYRTGNNQP